MQDAPEIETKFRHIDWNITFVIRAYRPISKREAAGVVQRYLLRNKGKPLQRGSRIIIESGLR
jgi:hypothetical protein